jgi:hypothetical protein
MCRTPGASLHSTAALQHTAGHHSCAAQRMHHQPPHSTLDFEPAAVRCRYCIAATVTTAGAAATACAASRPTLVWVEPSSGLVVACTPAAA